MKRVIDFIKGPLPGWIIDFVQRFINSLRFNGFYIFLALVFPYIIFKFDAGAEIIISMAEQGFALNIGLSLLAFSALTLSIWCIPTLAIWIFQVLVWWRFPAGNRSKNAELRYSLFRKMVRVYNGQEFLHGDCCTAPMFARPQLPVRYFAILPWALFILTCLNVYWGMPALITGIIVIIAAVFLADRLKQRIINLFEAVLRKNKAGEREAFMWRYIAILAGYFLIIAGLVAAFYFISMPDLLKILLCILNGIFLWVIYAYLLYMENSQLDTYLDKLKNTNKDLAYKVSNVNYWTLLTVLLLAIIVFYVLNQRQQIGQVSPAIVLVVMSTSLIIFFELAFTAQLVLASIVQQVVCTTKPDCILTVSKGHIGKRRANWLKIYRAVIVVLIFFVIKLYFFSSANSHIVRAPQAGSPEYIADSMRPALTTYFKEWYDARNTQDDSTVYLISGQGGGSRAAAWFFMNMQRLQNKYPEFFHKVFSLSTASGSTSGANMYLALQYYKTAVKPEKILETTTRLYGRNYMSSAFYGLLLGDFLESKADWKKPYPRDRNVHLQWEEEAAFRETFGITGSDQFFEQDFMAPYVKSPLESGRYWPLFLINSTVVNFGTRAVFSPVRMRELSMATDLYGEFKRSECNSNTNLPQVVCVNQSQAFPLLSAYNWFNCIGRLGDGGISENSGCGTTLEIYQELRRYCDQNNLKKIKFVCLNISNGSLDTSSAIEYKKASIFNTVAAVANGPFKGSESYAYRNLERQIQYFKSSGDSSGKGSNRNRDTVLNCKLETSITLTRTMSKQAVKTMYEKMVSEKGFTLPNEPLK